MRTIVKDDSNSSHFRKKSPENARNQKEKFVAIFPLSTVARFDIIPDSVSGPHALLRRILRGSTLRKAIDIFRFQCNRPTLPNRCREKYRIPSINSFKHSKTVQNQINSKMNAVQRNFCHFKKHIYLIFTVFLRRKVQNSRKKLTLRASVFAVNFSCLILKCSVFFHRKQDKSELHKVGEGIEMPFRA